MPIATSVAAVEQVLKLLYKKGVPNLSYNKQALLSKFAVDATFTGEKMVMALQDSNPQGFGSSFDRAFAHKSSAETYKRFELFRVQHYGFAQVTGEVMRTAVDPGALVNVWRNRTQSVVRGMQNSAGRLIYGTGTGRIGTVSALGTASTTITLQTAADIANFEVGMYIVLYTSESFAAQYVDTSGGAPTSTFSTAFVRQVTAVDRDINAGTATITIDSAATWPANAIIVRDGDGIVPNVLSTSYDTNARSPAGIEQWIGGDLIGSASVGNTLFGLDRSVDKVRLGGQVSNASGRNMVEALQDLEANILFQGIGYPTVIVANPLDIGDLKKSALSDVIRIPAQDPKQNLNFQDVVFVGQNGPIPFIQDPFCPRRKAYMLNLPTWSIKCAPGGMFQLVDWDSNTFLRLTDADEYQSRFVSYYQIACENPGSNGYLYNWGA
mgnify:CR=1 FL=1|jgi:hypothetical protein